MIDIVFEMPSHIYTAYHYVQQIAANCKSDRIGFVMALNGDTLNDRYNKATGNFIARYRTLTITKPCISLAEARSNANELATGYFDPKYRIMADHNFIFKGEWEQFILEAIQDMEHFSAITNRPCYMGMGGAFGSYGHKNKPFLGPQPIFPTGRGIIYTMGDAYKKMKKLPSSLDEQYLCSILFRNGHVPLRKMMSPIYHRMVVTDGGIHDKSLVDKYNSAIVREIWNDPKWVLKPTFTSKERLTDGRYYAHCPKTAIKEMARLKNELAKIPGVIERYLTVEY